jgi:hypothetical protein
MKARTSTKKSCGPQLLITGEPSHGWGVDELGQYCQTQHEAIVSGEKELTPIYWRLGLALSLARKHFGQGQWMQYLASLNIDKTRASKARAIFRAFSTAEQTAGMSVEEAYGKRHRKQSSQGSKLLSDEMAAESPLSACLDHMRRELECLIAEARSVTRDEALGLLQTTKGLICRLQGFERHLLQLANESNRGLLLIEVV